MATTDFGVTTAEVLAKAPVDSSQISATSVPVSTSDVEDFVDDADSQMAGLLNAAGISSGSLTDDAKRQIQEAIKAYAVAELLDAMGALGRDYDKYRDKWSETYQRYANRPQMLNERVVRTKTNINTSSTKPDAEFIGTGYQF